MLNLANPVPLLSLTSVKSLHDLKKVFTSSSVQSKGKLPKNTSKVSLLFFFFKFFIFYDFYGFSFTSSSSFSSSSSSSSLSSFSEDESDF